MKAALEVEGLEKSYGRRRVVDGVSLNVGEAEIVGLLGPNGAGKSTSFKMTCGIVKPDRGTVILNGLEVTDWPLFRRASEGGMGYLAQESSVFRKLTVEQNISSLFELLGVPSRERKERTHRLLEDFEITHLASNAAGRLSGGERRRLEIARCLISDPKIIMLDEPFAGIDPINVQNIQSIIAKLRQRGIAILITDHAAREILESVDRCYVISKGSVLHEGTPESVRNHPKFAKSILATFPVRLHCIRLHTTKHQAAYKLNPSGLRLMWHQLQKAPRQLNLGQAYLAARDQCDDVPMSKFDRTPDAD